MSDGGLCIPRKEVVRIGEKIIKTDFIRPGSMTSCSDLNKLLQYYKL